ncbi:aminodeoxychorismate synthase component I [Candidatus Desulforudis audaxviator]|uniref:aminodeoxychorismate synthase n=1 Tax=Desulforudis audaxviator (strain MP104C) TaxID=477974 RepID=B1I658_DESAP|nr:aminodeoxychorismate synthase component I [Candidatus Desulforudis audaxviator]ACA60523.1 para-aminobenzoate synthase, subunit I [Candidatus Desulforudis audaxviator MP104C]AZK60594.1 Para-aminobenzoate synthase, aminase component [Candidatus Desulforudis audaxviator]
MLVDKRPWPSGPEALYTRLENRPGLVILDSGMEPRADALHASGRWCFAAFDPFAVLECRLDGCRLTVGGRAREFKGDPLDILQSILEEYALPPGSGPTPLPAGGIGFLAYGLRVFLEPRPTRPDDLDLPVLHLGFYDAVLAFDRRDGSLYLTSTGLPAGGRARAERAASRMRLLREVVDSAVEKPASAPPEPGVPGSTRGYPGVPGGTRVSGSAGQRVSGSAGQPVPPAAVSSSFDRAAYLEAVRRVKNHILAGDVYQVNLAQRFSVPWTGSAHALFGRLCRDNPAPFSALIKGAGFAVVSASPERFLHLNPRTGVVHTRPIKGTRPRGSSPETDARLACELLASEKDRAEHIMIVDLERNDLSRVAQPSSVRVPEMLVLEPFPTVWHLVSTVEAELRPGTGVADLLRAAFPGGSITGAPKIRAMEIIEELEPVPRGVYTGAAGYFSFDGHLDLNITIRTIVLRGGRAWFHVGGGIVADSEPEAEYRETLDKARALFAALGSPGRREGG